MITPSMLEDFRMWRLTTKPEDLPDLERWIEAMTKELHASENRQK